MLTWYLLIEIPGVIPFHVWIGHLIQDYKYTRNIHIIYIREKNSKRPAPTLTNPTIVLKEYCVMSHITVCLSRWLGQVGSRPQFNTKFQLAKLTADHIRLPSPHLCCKTQLVRDVPQQEAPVITMLEIFILVKCEDLQNIWRLLSSVMWGRAV
jgi:hypothetical protein